MPTLTSLCTIHWFFWVAIVRFLGALNGQSWTSRCAVSRLMKRQQNEKWNVEENFETISHTFELRPQRSAIYCPWQVFGSSHWVMQSISQRLWLVVENHFAYTMRNLLNNLKTAITSRLRLSRTCNCSRAHRANNDSSKGKDLVEELSEWDRITKEDSKKERRQKFRHYFQRNNVCMVSNVLFLMFRHAQVTVWFLSCICGTLLSNCFSILAHHTASHRGGYPIKRLGRGREARVRLLPRKVTDTKISIPHGRELLCHLFRILSTWWLCCLVYQCGLRTCLSSKLHCQVLW